MSSTVRPCLHFSSLPKFRPRLNQQIRQRRAYGDIKPPNPKGPPRPGQQQPSFGVWAPKTRIAFGVVFISAMIYSMMTEEPSKLDPPSIAERDNLARRESGVTENSPMRLRMEGFIKEQQKEIVAELEQVDGKKFKIDTWTRENGGGGISSVLQDGNVFEKAGVNISIVYGTLPQPAIEKMRVNHKAIDPNVQSLEFFAAGLSMVLHPKNPMAPTVHLNYRYFETANPDGTSNAWWFGGGTDLTPSYLFDEDAIHFHKTIKEACDKHDKSYYPRFKIWCDKYFYNKHRGEGRGIGGIFFDDLDEHEKDQENTFAFAQTCLKAFLPSYIPIINKRKDLPYTEKEKEWQQVRRGRYVEFNLVHDRGTAFGLNTPSARVESILMSLPLTASWRYMYEPEKGSREQRLVDVLKEPREWVLQNHLHAHLKFPINSKPNSKNTISPRHTLGTDHETPLPPGSPHTNALKMNDLQTLPTPRTLLTSLINTLASTPPNPQSQLTSTTSNVNDHFLAAGKGGPPTNPLKSLPPSHRALLTTLHVLFPPGMLLQSLDLLDRGLVTRVIEEDPLVPSPAETQHQNQEQEQNTPQAQQQQEPAVFPPQANTHLPPSDPPKPRTRERSPKEGQKQYLSSPLLPNPQITLFNLDLYLRGRNPGL
ncbi:hypothetical protein G7Y89_g12432 [Cudoniella acicularis]|uniref:coproporphyrinogen oxidase n=1 Tax=Cudoniella acicularis TaxID=354080 RepID=A0A8H4VXD2_9HELO|nr:hypothetical protein G7Y89_g12432 [Cudoniella acicularis]